MAKKKFVWKKQYTPWAVAVAVILSSLFLFRMIGKMRVVNGFEQFQAQKGPQARFFLSPNAAEWAPRLSLPQEDQNAISAAQNPAGVWVVSKEIYLSTAHVREATLSHCSGGILDLFQKCGPGTDLYMLRFLGDPSEVAQARQLDSEGKFGEAKNVLEAYLNQVGPANAQGAAFYSGVIASKTGDMAMMERMYDAIGPYHLGNLQVLYNWGLVKLYVRKPAQGVLYLERAGKLAPNDVGVQLVLGDAYAAVGKVSKAKAIADRLAKIYPNDDNVKRKQQDWSEKR